MSFKGAKWDSDALGDAYDELFKNKSSAKKIKGKTKKTSKLKTPVSHLGKKKKNHVKPSYGSNNTVNSEILSKNKKKRLKKIRRQQNQINGNTEDGIRKNNRNASQKGASATQTIEKHEIPPKGHYTKVKNVTLNYVNMKTEHPKNNRNARQKGKSAAEINEKHEILPKSHYTKVKNVTLNSENMKTEHPKKKKKSGNLKKRLEMAVEEGTFMNHVNIKERALFINKKQIDRPSKSPKKKSKVHHQVSSPVINKKEKFMEKLKQVLTKPSDKKPLPTLRQKMLDKLKAARFRFLNEQIYSTDSKEAQKIFQTDPEAFKTYHDGYRKQVKRWPLNPLDVVIRNIKKMPKTHIIADFGCGDAKLSKTVSQKVFSFDLVAADETVIACDMSKVPLEDDSVDVAVFCLSLMGTNLHDYLLEANRVLKTGGILKVAEVESRFEDVSNFIKGVQHFGFKNSWKDLSHDLFYFMDFRKVKNIRNRKKAPTLSLLPCLYKKR